MLLFDLVLITFTFNGLFLSGRTLPVYHAVSQILNALLFCALGRYNVLKMAVSEKLRTTPPHLNYTRRTQHLHRHHGSYLISTNASDLVDCKFQGTTGSARATNTPVLEIQPANQSISSALQLVWSRRFDYYMNLLERTHFQNEVTSESGAKLSLLFARLVAHYSTFTLVAAVTVNPIRFSHVKASAERPQKMSTKLTRFIVCGLSALEWQEYNRTLHKLLRNQKPRKAIFLPHQVTFCRQLASRLEYHELVLQRDDIWTDITDPSCYLFDSVYGLCTPNQADVNVHQFRTNSEKASCYYSMLTQSQ
ncbi:Hypothetical_protein [Hexamita inflata]|uniref:Hypothetical_protein n=1 Tax=Hexamita inflata TaxID=28002 RepID=A0AA86U874_9EUKA|nr:Hypothetical protein HINF_LOCUS30421 [Hexamita inflata]